MVSLESVVSNLWDTIWSPVEKGIVLKNKWIGHTIADHYLHHFSCRF